MSATNSKYKNVCNALKIIMLLIFYNSKIPVPGHKNIFDHKLSKANYRRIQIIKKVLKQHSKFLDAGAMINETFLDLIH